MLGALPGTSFATEAPFHCLNDSNTAIEPIETAKRVLIDGRIDQLFAEMDTKGLFSRANVERIQSEFGFVYDNEGAVFCLSVQRNDFSDSFVSEVFMLRTSKSFLYVVIYAFNDGDGWTAIRFEFNSSMSELDRHIK